MPTQVTAHHLELFEIDVGSQITGYHLEAFEVNRGSQVTGYYLELYEAPFEPVPPGGQVAIIAGLIMGDIVPFRETVELSGSGAAGFVSDALFAGHSQSGFVTGWTLRVQTAGNPVTYDGYLACRGNALAAAPNQEDELAQTLALANTVVDVAADLQERFTEVRAFTGVLRAGVNVTVGTGAWIIAVDVEGFVRT